MPLSSSSIARQLIASDTWRCNDQLSSLILSYGFTAFDLPRSVTYPGGHHEDDLTGRPPSPDQAPMSVAIRYNRPQPSDSCALIW